jgi:hypothetical protein
MPQYRPLLHHESADLLRCVHMKPDVAIVIVGEQQIAVYALGGSGVAPRGSVPRSSWSALLDCLLCCLQPQANTADWGLTLRAACSALTQECGRIFPQGSQG